MKPDSEKTTFEKVKDTVVGKADNAAAKSQPESEKVSEICISSSQV